MSRKKQDVRELDLWNEEGGDISVEQADHGRAMLLIFTQGNKVRRVRINRRLLADLVAVLGNANGCASIRWNRRTRVCSIDMGANGGDAREVCSWPPGWQKPIEVTS